MSVWKPIIYKIAVKISKILNSNQPIHSFPVALAIFLQYMISNKISMRDCKNSESQNNCLYICFLFFIACLWANFLKNSKIREWHFPNHDSMQTVNVITQFSRDDNICLSSFYNEVEDYLGSAGEVYDAVKLYLIQSRYVYEENITKHLMPTRIELVGWNLHLPFYLQIQPSSFPENWSYSNFEQLILK